MVVRERGEATGLEVLCRLLGYTRQAYYKHQQREEEEAIRAELVVQEAMRIRVSQKRIGGRKLHYLLGGFYAEHKIKMGRDVLFRVLRAQGLLVAKRRKYKPRTTISCPWRRFPNLIKDFEPTAANQVWVSDITYLRVGKDFGYLSLITDAYSRMIVGYKLSHDLSARGPVSALAMALRNNPEREALIHHSDRGFQYCCDEYVKLLHSHGIQISMGEVGNPYDNARAERFMRTLKQEEVYGADYRDIEDARSRIGEFLEQVYNRRRLHSALQYLTPEEFEQAS